MQKIGFCERYNLTTAVLNGTKPMTRRLEKALERAVAEYKQLFGLPFSVSSQKWDAKKKCLIIWTPKSYIELKTRYKLGEVVAVAQAYNDFYNDECDPRQFLEGKGWTNKMFVKPSLMPHQIQITDVRVERLQDISDKDCLKEGIEYSHYERNWFYTNDKNVEFHSPCPRKAFASLINRPGVGRKGLWEENPWVVVYKFKLLK